ncbi:hypothetical protein ABPG72_014441 [Tetrahymena utriculariae]
MSFRSDQKQYQSNYQNLSDQLIYALEQNQITFKNNSIQQKKLLQQFQQIQQKLWKKQSIEQTLEKNEQIITDDIEPQQQNQSNYNEQFDSNQNELINKSNCDKFQIQYLQCQIILPNKQMNQEVKIFYKRWKLNRKFDEVFENFSNVKVEGECDKEQNEESNETQKQQRNIQNKRKNIQQIYTSVKNKVKFFKITVPFINSEIFEIIDKEKQKGNIRVIEMVSQLYIEEIEILLTDLNNQVVQQQYLQILIISIDYELIKTLENYFTEINQFCKDSNTLLFIQIIYPEKFLKFELKQGESKELKLILNLKQIDKEKLLETINQIQDIQKTKILKSIFLIFFKKDANKQSLFSKNYDQRFHHLDKELEDLNQNGTNKIKQKDEIINDYCYNSIYEKIKHALKKLQITKSFFVQNLFYRKMKKCSN